MADDLQSSVADRLRRVGQRHTSGRRILIDALARAGRPLTAAELVAAEERLPQSTTYRNLALLEQAGVVHRVTGTDDFARFELAEELTEHHHHLMCTACGQVLDVTPSQEFEEITARMVGELSAASAFTPVSHALDVFGRCAGCS